MPSPIQDEPKPVISKDPLTAEQIAVYRAMLETYTKGDKDSALNIANVTDPFTMNGEFTGSCPKDSNDAEPASSQEPQVIHRLDPAVALSSKMVLVDPDQQVELIRKNDPQHLIINSIKDQQTPTDSDLDQSLKTAFSTGLFTFSEIVFNKQHTRAILSYSFSCGRLCGHGNFVVLKKAHGKWKVGKVCGGWIS
jgi:hypothetical protein